MRRWTRGMLALACAGLALALACPAHPLASPLPSAHPQPSQAPWSRNLPPHAVQAAARTRRAPQTLVALGDSITFGLYLSPNRTTPSPLAFPSLIAKVHGWRVTNLGVPGWTSQDLLRALRTARFQTALQQASVVTIDIGSNDLLQATRPLLVRALYNGVRASHNPELTVTEADLTRLEGAVQRFSQTLPQVVAAVQRQTPAPVVLVALYDPFPDGHPLHALSEQMLAAANSAIIQTAAGTGSLFADAYLAFNHRQAQNVRVAQMDVHPTAAGQRALAACVEDVLQHPLANQPHAYAIAPAGAVIRQAPNPAAPAIYRLHGNEGALVTGIQGAWLQVVTPDGRDGFVTATQTHLLWRPWNDVSFRELEVTLVPWQTVADGRVPDAAAVAWQSTVYAPAAWLARLIHGRAIWLNNARQVAITTPGAAGVFGSAAPVPTARLIAQPGQAKPARIETAGIEVTVDGEPIRLHAEPFLWRGQVYVPIQDVWAAFGGAVKAGTHGLRLLSPSGS